jgi:hypothetical protein
MTLQVQTASSPPSTSVPPQPKAPTDVASLARAGSVADVQAFLKAHPEQQGAMETALAKNGRVGDLNTIAARPATGPESPVDWANEVMSWASPDGILLHALQPVAASALKRSGVGAGTDWGKSLQRVLDDPRSVASYQAGFREGVFDGAKSMVEGAWTLVKGAAAVGFNASPIGWLVEGAQKIGIVGEVPGWVPDAGRVIEPAVKMGEGIGRYVSEVSANPAKFGDDVKGWIAANWTSLKASHAAAAAKGGAEEAKWWGKIAGRATFEIAAIAVPVTKFATAAKAAEAVNLAVKAGKVGEVFAEAARVGKLAELVAGATKAGKMAEVVSEAAKAGRMAELMAVAKKSGQLGEIFSGAAKAGKVAEVVAEAAKAGRMGELVAVARKGGQIAELVDGARASGKLDALFGKAGLGLPDIAALENAGQLSKVEAVAAKTAVARETLREMLAIAPKAKDEADNLAKRIAGEFGGTVSEAPIKTEESALRKILADYGGNAARIKDLARNTIIVDQGDVAAVAARLKALGADVKVISGATDPLGYSGVNASFKTASGITAEIQVNTAKMIYAKESVAKAREILGSAVYDAIAKEVGVVGGRGHTLYEQYRVLDPASAQAQAIARESQAYYAKFR